MMRNCVKPALIAGLVLASSLASAEDIDLFMGVQDQVEAASNVLVRYRQHRQLEHGLHGRDGMPWFLALTSSLETISGWGS